MTVEEMAQMMKEVVGFHGNVSFDETKPEGTMRKLSDVSRLSKMGWDYTINLREGLEKTYKWYLSNVYK